MNTNAQYLSRELAALGITVHHQSVVGDNPDRLAQLVQGAKQRSDLLLFTGGLGPTGDDLTKETVAQVFNDTLRLDETELEKIRMFFECRGPMPHNNEKQAMVPVRGQKIENSCGTAPGVLFRDGGCTAILMPGVPHEMRAMFEGTVRGILAGMTGGGTIVSTMLHVFGPGESQLEELVGDLLQGENPTAALYAKDCEVAVRITARGESAEAAAAARDGLVQRFRDRLGDVIYSEQENGSLEDEVVALLARQHKTLAVAESCTGGLVAQRLTSVPGSSAVFSLGAVTYSAAAKRRVLRVQPSVIKKFSVYSAPVAAQMAFGVRREAKAAFGVGVTGIAGPDGGLPGKPVGTVYVAACTERKVWVRRLAVERSQRSRVRRMASQCALDMVRRLALGLPLPEARCFGRHAVEDF